MNDYKELIGLLAHPADGRDNADIMISAADAIEQLVKERDAAVADLEEDIKAIGKMEFLVKMCEAKYKNGGDEEYAHIDMDEIMCETLRSLGYEAGVAVFENTAKWYS